MNPADIRADAPVFQSFGEQLRAIAAAEDSGRKVDARLHEVHRRASTLGGSEMVPSDGGFLVAPEFSRQIVQRLYETGEIFKRTLQIPITTNGFAFPQFDESSRAAGSRLGGIQAYWDNEAAALIPPALGTAKTQKPTFNLTTLTPNKVTGLVYVTDELSMDSDAFATWASYAFGQELMFKLEGAIINGTGAGMPMGVIQAPATITVAKQPGQASGTVNSQNINAMLASLWARSYNSDGTIFIYNQALLPQLSTLATIVGTGGSESKLWVWASDPAGYDLLAGFPALASEHCPYSGSSGDIILLDLSRYILAIREQFRADVSIHVRFITNESAFRFIMRVAGQPIDRSPVTALNGGSPPYQTSPFVALAQR